MAIEVEEAVGVEPAFFAGAEDEAEFVWTEILEGFEVLGVGAELDQEVGLGRAGELRVERR